MFVGCSVDTGKLRATINADAGPETSVNPPDVPAEGPRALADAAPDVNLGAGDGPWADSEDRPRTPAEDVHQALDVGIGGGDSPSGSGGGGGSAGPDGPIETRGTAGAFDAWTENTGGAAGAPSADGPVSDGGSGGSLGSGGADGQGGSMGVDGPAGCKWGPFQTPEMLTGLGLDTYSQWGPSPSGDGKTLYFGASGSTGSEQIYVATRADRGTAFSKAVVLSGVNSTTDDGNPCISNDGLTLYYSSKRAGGMGEVDLWASTRAKIADNFPAPKVLAAVNGTNDDVFPWISADGLTLLFTSSRSGATDLYIATRPKPSGNFSSPTAVAGVNGNTTREDRAALSNDGLTIYFGSDRSGGMGGRDFWMGTRTDVQDGFTTITNLKDVNSTAYERDLSLSRDETELLFSSNRSGSYRLYRAVRTCQ
jgi:hypothetical protein